MDARWRRRASLRRVAVALLYFALLSAVRCAFVRARRARDRGPGVGMGGPGGTGMPLGRVEAPGELVGCFKMGHVAGKSLVEDGALGSDDKGCASWISRGLKQRRGRLGRLLSDKEE